MIDLSGIRIAVDFDGTIVEHEYPEIGRRSFSPFSLSESSAKKGQGLSCGPSGQARNLKKQWSFAGRTELSFMR